MLDDLEGERRAVEMRIGGEERWIASEDAGPVPRRLRRRAAGRPAGGVPGRGPGPVRTASLRRYARTHGPFTTRELRDRYAVDPSPVLRELERRGRPGARRAAPRRRRARVVRPRRAAPPAPRLAGVAAQGGRAGRAAGARALPALVAGRGRLAARRRRRGPAARGAGAAPGRGAGARGVGARRAAAPRGRLLAGVARPAVRLGRAGVGRRRHARPPLRQGGAATSARTPAGSARRRSRATRPREPLHDAIRERLRAGRLVLDRPAGRHRGHRPGRAAGGALGPGLGRRGDQRRLRPAARAAPVAGPRAARRRAARFSRRRRPGAPQVQGRWSLTDRLFADAPAHGPRMRAHRRAAAGALRHRHARDRAGRGHPRRLRRRSTASWPNLETLGTARRGYFVEGLGGAQFALPAAIERLRGLRSDEPAGALVLAATDPANPFGATAALAASARTSPAAPEPRAAAPTWSRSTPSPCSTSSAAARACCRCATPPTATGCREALEALADHVRRGRLKRLAIERFDGEPVVGSGVRAAADRRRLPPDSGQEGR